jgi:hypothetical protein
MDRDASFSVPEIVGIATAGAAALGGLIVALGRSQAHSVRDRAASINVKPGVEAATSGLEHGRDAVRSATERLADIWPDLRAQAEEVVARASEVPHGAAERVSGVASTTGERAQSIGSDVLGRVQETVIPAVGAFVEATRERTAEMTAHGDETVGGVVSTAGEAAERAVAATTSVAKETLATLFWLIAASAVVYFALLSSERRERVKGLLYGAVEQARLLMRDFQGYEEEM